MKNIFYVLILVIAAFLCGGNSAQYALTEGLHEHVKYFKIDGCESHLCELEEFKHYPIKITIVSPRDEKNVTLTPTLHHLPDYNRTYALTTRDTNGFCGSLVDGTCPLKTGRQVTYSSVLQIPRIKSLWNDSDKTRELMTLSLDIAGKTESLFVFNVVVYLKMHTEPSDCDPEHDYWIFGGF